MITEKNKFENIEHASICPECGSSLYIIPEKGEEVCTSCGLVVSERRIDQSKSADRFYGKEEEAKRCGRGTPVNTSITPDISMSTVIRKDEAKKAKMIRIVKWDTHMTWKERNLLVALTEVKRLSGLLKIPAYVQSKAMDLYKEIMKRNALRGRSILSMSTSALYVSCRIHEFPRKREDLLMHSNEKGLVIKRSVNTIIKLLGIRLPPLNYSKFISMYVSKLGLSTQIETKVGETLKKFFLNHTRGINPFGAIAGAIYIVCKMSKISNQVRTQSYIAEIVGVTEVTLRNRCKDILRIVYA